MSYDRPLLIGYKTLVINVFHMSSEIFTFTQRKNEKKIPKEKQHLKFPTKIKELSIRFKILIGFLIPTIHMCELKFSYKIIFSYKIFGKSNMVFIVSSKIFISSMGM